VQDNRKTIKIFILKGVKQKDPIRKKCSKTPSYVLDYARMHY